MFAKSFHVFKLSLCSSLVYFLLGCAKESSQVTTVYSNNFESGDLSGIKGGILSNYNSTMVLGQYNRGGFTVSLSNLPKHQIMEISFDLYIHDSWDGNRKGEKNDNGPDIWKLNVDGKPYMYTTFSNADCGADTNCFPQSFPYNYQNNSMNPKTNAFQTNLPGICHNGGQPNGTTLYKINKRIHHSEHAVSIDFLDELVQSNTADPKCDESWSLDNLTIKTIQL